MFETRFFKEHYPLTNATLSLMNDNDRKHLVHMIYYIREHVQKQNDFAEQRAARQGRAYVKLAYVSTDIDEKLIAGNIINNPSRLRQEDIEFLNDVLYYNKYVFAWLVQMYFPAFLTRDK